MTRLVTLAVAIASILVASAASIQAKQRHYGMICGLTQRLHFHLADKSLNLALEWAKKFPHVAARPGAVVVQRRNGRALGGGPGGHVSRIVSLTGPCRAMVTDEKGTYERDICKRLVAYVSPNG